MISTPVAISIFLCGSLRSSAIDEEEDADDAGEADEHALEHRDRAGLEGQRLEEEHGLEPLAVDAREPERDEAERLRGEDAEARARRARASSSGGGPARFSCQ